MPASAARRSWLRAALLALALTLPARAEPVGPGQRARPALGRVGVAGLGRPGAISAAAGLGGGVTEGLSDSDSAHARFAGSAAASFDAASWFNLGAWLGGRYDLHPRDARGSDDGFVAESELSARLAGQLGSLGLGLEAAAWLPGGSDIGKSFSALGADGRLLLSHQGADWVQAGYAGYRLDRSAKAAGDPQRLRFGDRTALGASDFDALLLGFGAGRVLGRTLLFGEATAQLLLGSPKLAASPIWLTLGLRQGLGPPGLRAELSLDALASARPEVGSGAPLFPIEPRVTLHLVLSYRFGEAIAVKPQQQPARPPPPVAPPAPPAPKPTSVELALLDDRGQPLTRAEVVVAQGDDVTPLVETEPGHYRLSPARPGRARLRIKAEGFQPLERDIEMGSGNELHLDVKVEQALPAGQVRGLVRSYRGKALSASIRLEPGGAQTKTDAEGFFQIDVPPGEYEVVIEALGYEPQRRKAKVDEHGVVIVNADLRQKR
jgi:hypothetical protein